MSIRDKLRNILNAVNGTKDEYDTLPPERMNVLTACSPMLRSQLIDFSVNEYKHNPYYKLVIENLANHTIGTSTNIIGSSNLVNETDNDFVEDNYLDWTSSNNIGLAFRSMRKQAALTGLAIGIPYTDMYSNHPVGLSYKVIGANRLDNPLGARPEDRIINGIEYDRNWEVESFHVKINENDNFRNPINTTKEYKVNEVLWWSRCREDGMVLPVPECSTAFSFYPYVRRYMQAVIESEEFNASFPMAVELDPKVYSTYASDVRNTAPTGTFEYEPKMVPTLAPGMSLKGIPSSVSAKDRERILQMFAAACALSVSMPRNIALGDSSNSNMSSSQVDIQPWANKVRIDRFDMEPMFRNAFNNWWAIAVRRIMPDSIRLPHLLTFPHIYVYPDLFEHPDPNKRASARATDLASGATTLNRMYSNNGLNFRREIEREAKALNITTEELINIYLSTRGTNSVDVMSVNQQNAMQ